MPQPFLSNNDQPTEGDSPFISESMKAKGLAELRRLLTDPDLPKIPGTDGQEYKKVGDLTDQEAAVVSSGAVAIITAVQNATTDPNPENIRNVSVMTLLVFKRLPMHLQLNLIAELAAHAAPLDND